MKKVILFITFCLVGLVGCSKENGVDNSGSATSTQVVTESSKVSAESSTASTDDLTTETNHGQLVFTQREYTSKLPVGKIDSQKKIDNILYDHNFMVFYEDSEADLEATFSGTSHSDYATAFDLYDVAYWRYDTTTQHLWFGQISAEEYENKEIVYAYHPNVNNPETRELKWSDDPKGIVEYNNGNPLSFYTGEVLPDGTLDLIRVVDYLSSDDNKLKYSELEDTFSRHFRLVNIDENSEFTFRIREN